MLQNIANEEGAGGAVQGSPGSIRGSRIDIASQFEVFRLEHRQARGVGSRAEGETRSLFHAVDTVQRHARRRT